MSTPVHYYEAHETEYVKRIRAGQVSWDGGAYDQFFMRPFVERCLQRASLPRPRDSRRRALDLGCGTGALSCLLAEAGFSVVGIDVAPTAVALAREMAARRGLDATFLVADLCRHPLPAGEVDLVVDGHLLHCIVFDHERRRLLEQVRRSLKPGGEFWMETMLLEPGHEPDPAWHLDDGGVVWASPAAGGERYREAVWRDGAWWLPQRRIARSPDALLSELRSAGLTVLEAECYPPPRPLAPGGLRARCTPASTPPPASSPSPPAAAADRVVR